MDAVLISLVKEMSFISNVYDLQRFVLSNYIYFILNQGKTANKCRSRFLSILKHLQQNKFTSVSSVSEDNILKNCVLSYTVFVLKKIEHAHRSTYFSHSRNLRQNDFPLVTLVPKVCYYFILIYEWSNGHVSCSTLSQCLYHRETPFSSELMLDTY